MYQIIKPYVMRLTASFVLFSGSMCVNIGWIIFMLDKKCIKILNSNLTHAINVQFNLICTDYLMDGSIRISQYLIF